MTEISSPKAPISAQHPVPVTAPSTASPTVNGSLSDAVVQDDNEDYTIKCICSYGDDDGSTVYCEKCETWQHIICYYQGKKVPHVHFCADCDPRQLDAKRATESQKRLREHVDGTGDRKAKRPPQKSHKKKKDSIATADQTNGLHSHSRHESVSAGRDQPPPAKRAKTSHRTSASIASMNGVPALPEPRKRASSNVNAYPSPTKSPLSQPLHPAIPMYSPQFLNLYEDDQGKNNIDCGERINSCSNSMSMAVTNALTSWYDSPQALQQDTGRQHEEVFHQSEQPLRPHSWPRVHLRERTNTDISYNGKSPRWKFVVLETSVGKDDFIGEVKGDIGRLEDYCLDPGTRWNELHHPEPFVFFHPQMPIYIDSRAEGTQFRYLRRSCHPNVSLKTFVTGERDFHHCFVAKENIPAGTELTAMWYIDQTLFNNGKVKEENGDEEEARRPATYFSKILSNFGDCACDSSDCWLKNFDLRTPSESPKRRTDGRRSRVKVKNAASPASTGHATNSRAGSENIQLTEEDDQVDSRSTSDSARSKPQSRDITPADTNFVGPARESGQGLSTREKRKILMAEKAFENQETQKQRAKRKRTSGGPSINTPAIGSKNASTSATSLPTTPSLISKPPQLNTASTNNFAGSPPLSAPLRKTSDMSPRKSSGPNTPSPFVRYQKPIYVDRGMQTDAEPGEPGEPEPEFKPPWPGWENWEHPNLKRVRIAKEWARKDDIKREELKKKVEAGLAGPYATIVPTWLEERRERDKRRAERRAKEAREREGAVAATVSPSSDVSHSTNHTEESKPAAGVQLPPPPLPSQAAHTQRSVRPPNAHKLQLSTLPPVPTFSTTTGSATQGSTGFSPTPTTPSAPQLPFGYGGSSHSYPGLSAGTVAPSPVKKKLSLGDYMSRRSNLTTPTAEKTQAQATGTTATATVSSTAPTTPSGQQVPSNPAAYDSNISATIIKPDDSIRAEAKAMDDVEESAILDPLPTKDDSAAAAPTIAAPAQSSFAYPSRSPELSNMLSTLQALAGSAARRESSSSR
jgi:uncharacterized protein